MTTVRYPEPFPDEFPEMRPAGVGPSRAGLLRLEEGGRILTQAECEGILQRLQSLAQGGGMTDVYLISWWHGELRWARNRATLASDRRDVRLTVMRTVEGRDGEATTNQIDPAGLEEVIRSAERSALDGSPPGTVPVYQPLNVELPNPKRYLWSDATARVQAEEGAGLVRAITEPAEEKGMLSAGYLELRAQSYLWQRIDPPGLAHMTANTSARYVDHGVLKGGASGASIGDTIPYTRLTQAQCSTTVRDAHGTGSGWAGLASYDWPVIDVKALGAQALEKGLASRNPVALEPGRYTVILEAQALADLLAPWINSRAIDRRPFQRDQPEKQHLGMWYLGDDPTITLDVGGPDGEQEPLHRSKVGKKVFDERVTLSFDPSDPELGIPLEPWPLIAGTGARMPITWVKNGILTQLGQTYGYDVQYFHKNGIELAEFATGYRMSGGTTTVEEMIQSTKRGLLVTRFWNVEGGAIQNATTWRCHGLTRDGLWLIENGKITKPVKNFRFVESPDQLLNRLEQLGVPQRVFMPTTDPYYAQLMPTIVPPVKVRDFSFTGMVDAV